MRSYDIVCDRVGHMIPGAVFPHGEHTYFPADMEDAEIYIRLDLPEMDKDYKVTIPGNATVFASEIDRSLIAGGIEDGE